MNDQAIAPPAEHSREYIENKTFDEIKVGDTASLQRTLDVARVISELKTTFASTYTKEISLSEALKLEEIAVYGKQGGGADVEDHPPDVPERSSADRGGVSPR